MTSSFMKIAFLLLLHASVVLLLLPVVVVRAENNSTTASCASSFVGEQKLEGKEGVVLRQYVQSDAGTFTVQVSFPGQGWVGFGFGKKMKGSKAVIGLPGAGSSNNDSSTTTTTANPGLYDLTEYTLKGVIPLTDQEDLLTNASIVQSDEGTTLTFTLPTVWNGTTVVQAGQLTDIIYAVGKSNVLAYHAGRRATQAYFTECGTAAPALPTITSPQEQPAASPSPDTTPSSDGSSGNAPTMATPNPPTPTAGGSRAPPSTYSSCCYGIGMFLVAFVAPGLMLL